MKKIITLLATFVFAFSIQAVELKEGVHFEVIAKEKTETPEIKEFFSYYCPHCLSFEPLAAKLKKSSKAQGIEFKKSHVDFLRAAGPDIQELLTRALVASDKLNVPQVSTAIFNYIHKQRAVFTSEKDVKNLFLVHGVSAEQFDKAFNSFAVKAASKKMKKDQVELSQARVLTSVPTFIVNGKYKILSKGFKASTYDDLFSQLENAALELAKKD
ncbi:thiol:disulfide interchange protein DsbA/DsbL [Psychrosphaera sp. B3R10]|uniref:Thiol:disulfide interchange protein n=1 Tax=Psychrosphaera algicola TaxID=3023714 RepID=A0ABT5FGD4_9GAMM|nr:MULTISPECIES: thiol:disulfide interchange protein DsbA/DsbL [unclassified Psychrosphaera]MBU2883402.1 thiol:disulfide interchange protein DsbA/DsbL [Psychrosphaera sp. I2R16]MBU2990504.1 thiol:disulfide interchange protein DsbA/DsbL [Psychrosphaera sp. B3R10]MDC2889762.1 thiol:disulfide interchange protein DsbA/DsbL [Psychrosphaera sp. G1-22]MDO6719022.1 thiol:disulfide interchange protein DsbA/DsbL [Psychrosphaera sp. 1_MG-2023]